MQSLHKIHKLQGISRIVSLLLCLLVMTGCQEEDNTVVGFIGDSIIARWDVKKFFPNTITINKGSSGSGLSYIQKNQGCMNGMTAVVLFGTNDISLFSIDYASAYMAAIKDLNADRTILISILPRNREGDVENVNQIISSFNNSILVECISYGWQYIDAYSLMQQNGEIEWDFFSDGVHLTEHGYELLTNEIKKLL